MPPRAHRPKRPSPRQPTASSSTTSPPSRPTVEPAYTASLATIDDGQAEDDGIATGELVAARLIDLRADDGFRGPVTYTPPNPPVPGVWIPTGPTPIGPYLGLMRPFALDSADQFRPDGPPDLQSKRWARDYNEVREIGSSTSTTRTADQTLAARFWAEAPVQQARGSFRTFVLDHDLDIVDASRFMAMVSVVYADALIACFDAKYHYAFWRPVTAIRAGESDGNASTVGDPAWAPLLPATPNHPEYPSAHSCITPSGGRVIARFLQTPFIDFTVPSLTGLGDRYYATVKDLAGRGRKRPHLGWDPLPHGGRGRHPHRQAGRPGRARPPLPEDAVIGDSSGVAAPGARTVPVAPDVPVRWPWTGERGRATCGS